MSDGPLSGDEHLREDVNIPENASEDEDGITAEAGPVLSNAAQHAPIREAGNETGVSGGGTASAEES